MLVFTIAVGAYENRDSFLGDQGNSSTEAGVSTEADATDEADTSAGADISEEEDSSGESENSKEAGATESKDDTIPVEVVPGTEKSGM